jgi:hypothetical protein
LNPKEQFICDCADAQIVDANFRIKNNCSFMKSWRDFDDGAAIREHMWFSIILYLQNDVKF